MNKPLISIVIPAYNTASYISDTLTSVSSQTYENWECIIVNDGSTDNTEAIIHHFIQNDKNKTKFRFYSKENEGHSRTRNYGIDKANGDYIAFLDSDDIWTPHHLEHLMDIMRNNNVDFVFSKPYIIEENLLINKSSLPTRTGILYGKDYISTLLSQNEIATPGVLCKKAILIQVGKFSYDKNAEDLHLWLKLLFNNATFYGSPSFTFYVRRHHHSTSSSDLICSKDVLGMQPLLKNDILNIGINYKYFFILWARKYFLINDSKEHYIEAINYIHSIDKSFFPIFRHITPLLPKKVLKILTLFILKRY